MKNYIGLLSVVGAMILSGCAGAVPQPVEPVGVTELTSAELARSELAPSPYTHDALPPWWAEDPWGPSVRLRNEPLPAEDPWAAATPTAPTARTWGATSAAEYGF